MSDRCYTVVESTRSVVVQPLDCDRTPIIVNEVTATAVVQPVQETRHHVIFAGVPGRQGGTFPDVDVDGKLYGRKDEAWVPLGSAALADAGVFATQSWVGQQGYLTQHQSLAGYATETWVTNQGYVTTDTTYNNATTTVPGLMSAADKSKLDDVEAQATKNQSDAHLLNRQNHTGTQTLSTISDAGSAASKNVPASGNASASEVVLGNDTRFVQLARSTSTTLEKGSFHHIDSNITIPSVANGAPPVGSIIPVYLSSNSERTVTPDAGVTLRHSGTSSTGVATIAEYGSFTLSHVNTNEWRISGDLV